MKKSIITILVISIIVVFCVLFKHLYISVYIIPSTSMEDTLKEGDYVVCLNSNFPSFDINYPDIIVFSYPFQPKEILIKRVIAIPGDQITIKDDRVYKNDSSAFLYEPYAKKSETIIEPYIDGFNVPYGSYFVLGDNRAVSEDSRLWGYVKRENIKAKAILRISKGHISLLR